MPHYPMLSIEHEVLHPEIKEQHNSLAIQRTQYPDLTELSVFQLQRGQANKGEIVPVLNRVT